MEYINFEADEGNQNLSSDDEFSLSPPNDNFINDCVENDPPSFYRFVNQSWNLAEALDNDDQSHLHRRDLQPEMFFAEKRQHVEFDDLTKRLSVLSIFLERNLLISFSARKNLFS